MPGLSQLRHDAPQKRPRILSGNGECSGHGDCECIACFSFHVFEGSVTSFDLHAPINNSVFGVGIFVWSGAKCSGRSGD